MTPRSLMLAVALASATAQTTTQSSLPAPAFAFSGASTADASAFTASAGTATFAADHLGVASGAAVLASGVALGTAPLPQLPTGLSARTVSAWVQCAAPATGAGRTLIDTWDGTASVLNERFTLVGVAATSAASITVPTWMSTTVAGSATSSTGTADGVGTSASFNNPNGFCVTRGTTPAMANFTAFTVDRTGCSVRMVTWANNVPGGSLKITRVAGSLTSTSGYSNGVGTNAKFTAPFLNCQVDPSGLVVYVGGSDNSVRSITLPGPIGDTVTNLNAGNVQTFVGTPGTATTVGAGGFLDGVGTAASFKQTCGLVIDPPGTYLYVGDITGFTIRRVVLANATVQTVLGKAGTSGSLDGVGTSATFNAPRGLAIDPTNTYLYVTDYALETIRRVVLSTMTVTTIAGTATTAIPVNKLNQFGASATFYQPYGVQVDAQGNLLISDNKMRYFKKLYVATGLVAVIGGNGLAPSTTNVLNYGPLLNTPLGMQNPWLDPDTGSVWAPDYDANQIKRYDPPANYSIAIKAPVCNGKWRHLAATFDGASTVAVWVDGSQVANLTTPWSVYTAAGATSALNIGGVPGYAAESFAGSFSDVRVYNSSLSAAQIAALSQPPLPVIINASMTPAAAVAGTTTYTWTCATGFAATLSTTSLTMTLNTATNTWGAISAAPSTLACAATVVCAPGQYATSSSACAMCPAGSISAGTSMAGPAVCVACAPGQFADQLQTVCSACPLGTASGGAASNSCPACSTAAGSAAVAVATGSISCTTCPANSYQVNASTPCAPCAAGFGTGTGTTGGASTLVGQVTCTSCIVGYVSTSGSQCTQCAAGTAKANVSYCAPCGPGTAAPSGSSFCSPCASGQIAASSNMPACTPCAGGTYATSATTCATCAAGTFSPTSVTGAVSCTSCPFGSISAAGALACTPIALGTYLSAGAPVACTGSTYSFGGSSAGCSPCPAGTAFVSSTAGCAPLAATASPPTDSVFAFSGASAEGIAAFAATNPAGMATYANGPFGASGGALKISTSSYLSSGALLPQLPTATAARSVSAWVKCPAPAASATLIDFSDGTGSTWTERLSLLGLPASGSPAISVPAYTSFTLAGSATCASGYADGTGTAALFSNTNGLCFGGTVAGSPAFNLLFATDRSNHRVRQITLGGVVTTLAGSGLPMTVDGFGTNAAFNQPLNCAVDAAGSNVYIAGSLDHSIRMINLVTKEVSTFAGPVPSATPWINTAGFLDGAGTSAKFSYPVGLAFDQMGFLWVGDTNNCRVRKISPARLVSTVAGSGVCGSNASASLDGFGLAATFSGPRGLSFDPLFLSLYVADYNGEQIRRIRINDSFVSTVAGTFLGTDYTAAFGNTFYEPTGLAFDKAGSLWIGDDGHMTMRKYWPATGLVATVAGSGASPTSGNNFNGPGLQNTINPQMIAFDANNNVYSGDYNCNRIFGLSAPASYAVTFNAPVCDSKWHHVTATFNGYGYLNLYIDGIARAAAETNLPIYTAGGFNSTISLGGSLVPGVSGINGNLADVRVFSRELADWEAETLSQPPIPAFSNTVTTPAAGTAGATLYTTTCAAGYSQSGAAWTMTRSAVDFSWAQGGPAGGPTCTQCAAGSFAAPGAASCSPCPTGSFSTAAGAGSCATCAAGTFNSVTSGTGAGSTRALTAASDRRGLVASETDVDGAVAAVAMNRELPPCSCAEALRDRLAAAAGADAVSTAAPPSSSKS